MLRRPKINASTRLLNTHFKAIRSAFSPAGVPCSVGTFSVDAKDLVLYYGKPGSEEVSRRLDFSNASEDDLRKLAECCDPASFGRNSEAVFDENYRKAGKLDVEHFAAIFDPERCGLMNQLRCLLLEGHDESTGVRSELYKLNVYGPGSFFKMHKDTPRSEKMFASLVVVLPTAHTGGALNFKHGKQSLHFDSAEAVTGASSPSIAYAAFFSDTDHEVEVVQSGYRVTLTYNLYYTSSQSNTLPVSPYVKTSMEDYLKQSIKALLDDENVLPESGLLGFGMRHQYTPAALQDRRLLKGTDAILAKVCNELGVTSYVRIVYLDPNEEVSVLMKKAVRIDSIGDEPLYTWLCDDCGGLLLDPCDEHGREPDINIHWVTEKHAENLKMSSETVATYGNEPSVEICYWYFCFIVEVNRGKDSAEIGRVVPGDESDSEDDMD